MIVALLNQRHGVGNTTLALHLAGLWACQTRHVTVIDADPQGRVDGPSQIAALTRSALLTVGLLLVPVQLPFRGRFKIGSLERTIAAAEALCEHSTNSLTIVPEGAA
jgi:cellulose biosynthesis protein BcsQ